MDTLPYSGLQIGDVVRLKGHANPRMTILGIDGRIPVGARRMATVMWPQPVTMILLQQVLPLDLLEPADLIVVPAGADPRPGAINPI